MIVGVAVLSLAAVVGCGKSKSCSCTTYEFTSKSPIENSPALLELFEPTTTTNTTVKVDEMECSDLNAEQTRKIDTLWHLKVRTCTE